MEYQTVHKGVVGGWMEHRRPRGCRYAPTLRDHGSYSGRDIEYVLDQTQGASIE